MWFAENTPFPKLRLVLFSNSRERAELMKWWSYRIYMQTPRQTFAESPLQGLARPKPCRHKCRQSRIEAAPTVSPWFAKWAAQVKTWARLSLLINHSSRTPWVKEMPNRNSEVCFCLHFVFAVSAILVQPEPLLSWHALRGDPDIRLKQKGIRSSLWRKVSCILENLKV